jgi:hypothetical protein
MAVSLESLRRTGAAKPPILLAYGVHKIGKTTLAASAPAPVFIQTEDGDGGFLQFDTFGLLKSYGEVIEAIAALDTDEHSFKTVAIDSMDWLETLVWQQVCKDNGWKTIEQPGYGAGYISASSYWKEIFDGLAWLRDERRMSVIMLAHCEIKRFDSPETDPYDTYQPKLHKTARGLLSEFADAILFANYRTSTTKADVGMGKKVTRAVGGGDRVLYTEKRPAFDAGNRWRMPPSLPLDWAAVAEHIPYFNPKAAQAAPAMEQ